LNLLRSNKAKPLFDVWYGGTGDPHLLAAEVNLTETYKSENLKNLHPWALKQAELSAYKTIAAPEMLAGPDEPYL
jgi:iron(III) transport system substrate-binding protein